MSKFKNALITGGAGFIGSHLSEELLRQNVRVTVLDNLSTGKKESVPAQCNFVQGDILDQDLVKNILSKQKIDIIFHLAARVTIRDSVRHFYEDAKTNLFGTLALLEAMRDTHNIKKFVFASSMAVYADSQEPKPLGENYKMEPISPYGISKLASEKYVLNLCKELKVQSAILRYFNTYGTRQTFTPYVGVITIFINKLLKNETPVIFGDGEQKRDFVSVEDIVQATTKAMDFEGSNEIFNVGTGIATSVNEIAQILCKKINPDVKPTHGPAQPGELRNSIANIDKAKKLLNYTPSQRIEEGIAEVIEFIKQEKLANAKS